MDKTLIQRVLDMACAIQQIPAPPFGEAERADFVQRQFESAGLSDVHKDGPGNVLARLPGRQPGLPVIVSAHLDTVFPASTDLALCKEDERIYGPGIGDNSLGVAALFALAWTFLQPQEFSNPADRSAGEIWLVANVGEEGLGDLRGMRAVVDHFSDRVRAYVVLEGMALGQIYHRGLGVQRYRITAKTAGGHSWVDFGRPSAIHALAQLVTQLVSIPVPAHPRTSLNVGMISGGTSINTIASQAQLELDLRSEGSEALDALVAETTRLVSTANSPEVCMTAEVIGSRPSGSLPVEHPLIQLARGNMLAHGMQPNLITGSTDANIPLSKGYPAVCVGITNGGGAHTQGEYILTRPVEKGLAQLISLVGRIISEL